jgi:3-phosphoshikimate 1-carboxyvinyltransferase
MALAVAGLAAEGRTIINGADSISKSYPGFASDLAGLGADIRTVE